MRCRRSLYFQLQALYLSLRTCYGVNIRQIGSSIIDEPIFYKYNVLSCMRNVVNTGSNFGAWALYSSYGTCYEVNIIRISN